MGNLECAMRETREIIEASAKKVYESGPIYEIIMSTVDNYEEVLVKLLGVMEGA